MQKIIASLSAEKTGDVLLKNSESYQLNFTAEETGFEPARACLRAQGVSNPPQWANYATPPYVFYYLK